ncbi:hypothetical protein HYT95_00850 [Candidatus Peregrinibacteria bacterium]|nr:hypothetical protein [Candidatus Peregrinibacteria bacterium]
MHTKPQRIIRGIRVAVLGSLCVVASFALGIHTAGDIAPIASLQADGPAREGDINDDGTVNVQDVIEILEIVRGDRQATAHHLRVDPNADGQLTIDDAIHLLQTLAARE